MVIGINTVSSQSGRAYCADFLQRGYPVFGFAHESERGRAFVDAVHDIGGIFLDRPVNSNNEKKQFFNIEPQRIGHDLEALVTHSDFIILAEPSHFFIQSIKEMKEAGLLNRRVPIVLSPSRSFSTPYIWQILGERYPVVSFSTCPYSCKAPRNDTSYIKRRKRNWRASLEGEFSLSQIAELGQLFPQAIFNKKPVTSTIENIGAVFHPTTYLLNYDEIQKREANGTVFSFYMDGIYARPEVGAVLEEIDQMRLQIANALGFGVYGLSSMPREEEWKTLMDDIRNNERGKTTLAEIREVRHDGLQKLKYSITSCQHWLDYTYGVERIPGERLSDTIGRTPTYQKNSVPQRRYVEEDVATGLIPLTAMAHRLAINTDAADRMIELCEKLFPDRDKTHDRTLEEFPDEYLIGYLNGDYFTLTD